MRQCPSCSNNVALDKDTTADLPDSHEEYAYLNCPWSTTVVAN
ncbi:MAG: hypothetical protein J07HX5_00226 [halophilic archaeon J07HX5]|nr:MAG: hypothetical protein J07HX5_00226 [halophilic archaeon J07HX5]